MLMPKILVVKTSSIGDVIHNLPAVSDIRAHFAQAEIDWVVEESLCALPRLHPGVRNVIPVAIRRWRKALWKREAWREMAAFKRRLRTEAYDFVLDAQGLIKSALITRLASGMRCGLDWRSAREPLAFFYDRTFSVPWSLHAVERNRSLAAQALGYELAARVDYGIRAQPAEFPWLTPKPYAVLLHVTSGAYKLWPEERWIELGDFLSRSGLACVLPWGSAAERARSARLAARIEAAVAPPALALEDAASLLAGARVVIGVDTGLTHLTAALDVPVVGIYCGTDPKATGLYAPGCAVNLGDIGQPPAAMDVIAAVERVRRRC